MLYSPSPTSQQHPFKPGSRCPRKKGSAFEAHPIFSGALVNNKRLLTTLANVTAARVDYPAATGIYHVETTAAIGYGAIAARRFVLDFRFMDLGFIVGHGETSLICLASPFAGAHGLLNLHGLNDGSRARLQ